MLSIVTISLILCVDFPEELDRQRQILKTDGSCKSSWTIIDSKIWAAIFKLPVLADYAETANHNITICHKQQKFRDERLCNSWGLSHSIGLVTVTSNMEYGRNCHAIINRSASMNTRKTPLTAFPTHIYSSTTQTYYDLCIILNYLI